MAPRMCAPDPLPVSLSNGGAQCPADFQRVGRSFASAQDDMPPSARLISSLWGDPSLVLRMTGLRVPG